MGKKIVIDPVTRIEGHAKITVALDDAGAVSDATFHVTEFRGFERFCVGRPFWEMPALTARVCGICPVSHLLASARAGDGILGVDPPPGAQQLRRLMNLGQIIQSHALSFFHLSGPDLFLGFDTEPAKRNLFGLLEASPELARGGIRLRQFGQDIIEVLGGRKIHPAWAIPGGVREPLTESARASLRARIPEAKQVALDGLTRFKALLDQYPGETAAFGTFPSLFMGLVGPDDVWDHHDGSVRICDAKGNILEDRLPPEQIPEKIGEAVEPSSYLKSPYYKPHGYPDGLYRVGPLARLNVCRRMGTPEADRELETYRQLAGPIAQGSFFYHYARLIEILASLERVKQALDDPSFGEGRLCAEAGVNRQEAIGISEAPRGTLFHHYKVDSNGQLTWVNLIIATGQNNLAMNRTVTQIAQHYIRDKEIPEGVLNRIEAGVRAYDPCLSCSTHAIGAMPLIVQLVDCHGRVVAERQR